MSNAGERMAMRVAAWLAAERDVGAAVTIAPSLARLRDRLERLIGTIGFDALLARCLTLAKRQHPSFMHVDPAMLFAERAFEGGTRPERDAFVIDIVVHLASLLSAFIGPALTLTILRDVWPHVTAADVGLGRADEEIST
jgi:hypothetical protein